ncbi:phenylalanine 4-monooxygenase [Acetobacteraceae bacterium]|nr:phenylalanine 4-monooxygenase [Acetobacteraceae bacterium]
MSNSLPKSKTFENEKASTYHAKIPDANGFVHYDAEEHAVWGDLVARQTPLVKRDMVGIWQEGAEKLGLLSQNGERKLLPSTPEISEKLQKMTGWKMEAVPAVIGFERFYEMLSEKVFPAASFIRRREHFDYVEEPDIFHEIFGHAPLLTHPAFAQFCQKIGETGKKCAPKDRAWLIRLFWFSIEFGLMQENGQPKGLGAGLASSVEELQWSVSGKPEYHKFDVMNILRTSFRIDIPQVLYFVLESPDQLFGILDRDLHADIQKARALGLFEPKFPPKKGQKAPKQPKIEEVSC